MPHARVNQALVESPEYRRLFKIHHDQHGRLTAAVSMDGTEFPAFHAAYEAFMQRAKKGLAVQRYKGLGEMNPVQLWETTMDPDRRLLLRVTIEDAVEADRIFSILMGDLVEPRKAFIIQNALRVKNLDV